jgi:hypothetical protein
MKQMHVGCWGHTRELEQVWRVGSLGMSRKRVDSANQMDSEAIERGPDWPLRRILRLEQVSLLGHTGIVGRQLKGYHSLCLTVWLISRVRLGDTCTEKWEILTGRGHGKKVLFRYLLSFYSAGYLLGVDVATSDAKIRVLVLESTLYLRLCNESNLFILDIFVQMPLGYLDLVLALTMKTLA